MTITRVRLSDDQKKLLLPPDVRGLLYKKETMVFAAADGDALAALAVVVSSEAGLSKYCVRFLRMYGSPDRSVLELLLDRIENMCGKKGCELLAVKITGDIADHLEANFALTKNHYTPINLNGKFLMYNFSDIAKTEFSKKVENHETLKKYVKFARQVDKKQLAALYEKLQRSNANLDPENPDLLFGRYFVVNGKLTGYMDMREVFPAVLMLYDVYVENSKETINAVPIMLASVIQLSQAMMPEDTVVMLPLYAEYLYRGFKEVFGEPAVEHNIFEYAKKIKSKGPAVSNDGQSVVLYRIQNDDEDEINDLSVDISGFERQNKEPPQVEEKLEILTSTVGTDIFSPAMIRGQRRCLDG